MINQIFQSGPPPVVLPESPVRRRILAVDDETMLLWTLGMVLDKAGYDVRTFNDPLLLLQEFHRREPDLVISDVMMPEMSGIDLAITLRQHRPACRIVLLSGQVSTLNLLSRAKEQGLDFEVFPKPFAPKDLLRFIQEQMNTRN